MRIKGYKQLIVWQRADQYAFEVYKIAKKFPREERFGLISQLCRSAISIPTNIVEGSGRQHKNETKQFVNIALGSLAETEYLLDFSKRLNYLTEKEYDYLDAMRDELARLLWGFYRSFTQ